MRLARDNGGHHLRRGIGDFEPQRKLLLGGELACELDVESGQLAIRAREVDDGSGTNEDDQLPRRFRWRQRPRTANGRDQREPDRDGEGQGDKDRAAERTHGLSGDDGGKRG